jgi:hypothetical protein
MLVRVAKDFGYRLLQSLLFHFANVVHFYSSLGGI